jgi:COX assembly protein 2
MHPHLHTEEVQKSMSPPSAPHTYSSPSNLPPGCAEVVAALEECHARGFLWKVAGNCTDAKYRVNMCLRGLRLERTRQNREQALEKRQHIKKVWAELDADKYTEAERAERFGGSQEKGEGV